MLVNLLLNLSYRCYKSCCQRLQLVGLASVLMLVGNVYAGNEFSPYVGMTVLKDSNLYRLDSSRVLPADSDLSKEDTLYQTTAGVAVDWSLSRQNFLLDAAIVDNRFDQNSNLDYVGQTLDLKWNWVVGNDLTGSVGFVQKITQNDFSNTASQEASKKEDGTAQFLAKWRYARDWELGVSLSDYALNYDLQALKINDRKSVKKTVFINYISHSSNWVGVTLLQEDGSYPRRNLSSSSVIDNKFQQNSILLNMNWRVTGKSRLQADVGWNARTHPNISSRDYDGLSVKAIYSWFPTGKTMVDVSLYRQLISSSYRDSSFSESTGYSLGVSWRMSEKVSFSGTIKDELRDYLGQESSFKERYSWITLGASYQLSTMFNVALQFNQSTRDSTQIFRDYGADSFVLSLNLKF